MSAPFGRAGPRRRRSRLTPPQHALIRPAFDGWQAQENAGLGLLRLSGLVEKIFMSAEQPIEVEGTIAVVLPGTLYRVKLDNQHEVLAHISGKMRKHFIRLTAGDRVRMEMSPYDLSKARITFRLQ